MSRIFTLLFLTTYIDMPKCGLSPVIGTELGQLSIDDAQRPVAANELPFCCATLLFQREAESCSCPVSVYYELPLLLCLSGLDIQL